MPKKGNIIEKKGSSIPFEGCESKYLRHFVHLSGSGFLGDWELAMSYFIVIVLLRQKVD